MRCRVIRGKQGQQAQESVAMEHQQPSQRVLRACQGTVQVSLQQGALVGGHHCGSD